MKLSQQLSLEVNVVVTVINTEKNNKDFNLKWIW